MLRAILRTAVTLVLLAWIFPTVSIASWTTLVLASIVLSVLFAVVAPILKLLFLPVTIVTLGLFAAVINVFLLWLATYLVPGFAIEPMILLGVRLGEFMSLVVIAISIGFLQSLIRKFL